MIITTDFDEDIFARHVCCVSVRPSDGDGYAVILELSNGNMHKMTECDAEYEAEKMRGELRRLIDSGSDVSVSVTTDTLTDFEEYCFKRRYIDEKHGNLPHRH